MNDIIETQLESAISTIIAGLVSFLLANLPIVLLIVVILVGIIALMTVQSKHKHIAQLIKRSGQLQLDTTTKLSKVLVTDTFKELELGLAQGETERGLQRMEKAAYGLHQQSEQLGIKLKEYRSNYFAPLESLHRAQELELEAVDLYGRVERYLGDLTGIEQSTRNTGQHMRQLRDRLDTTIRQIEKLGEERNYPLDEIRRQLKQLEEAFEKTDQLAAFDAIQAKPESVKLGRLIDALHQRTQELQKNITIMDQIRVRLQKQEEQLKLRMEHEQLKFADNTPLQIFRKTDTIVERIEAALSSGQEVELRTVASDIEQILQQVHDRMDSQG